MSSSFNDTDNHESVNTQTETTSFVDQLVGEGKKFRDIEELAKGKLEADRYIEELRSKTPSEEINHKLEELITRLSATNKNNDQNSQTDTNTQVNTSDGGKPKPTLDAESVEALVQKALKESQSASIRQKNLETVEAALEAHYGEKSNSSVVSKARELGMSVSRLQEIAEESPSAFYNLMGMNTRQNTGTTFNPSVNGEARTPSGTTPAENERWSYFKKLKKEDPKKFYSSMSDIERLIDKYGAGTFYST